MREPPSLSDLNAGIVSQAKMQVTAPSRKWAVHGSYLKFAIKEVEALMVNS